MGGHGRSVVEQSQFEHDHHRGERRRQVGLLVILCVAVVLVYTGSLDGAFVSDDRQVIENNDLLKSLSWPNIQRIFTSFDDANYIPLKVLSLAIDQRLFGPSPTGYHVTNLVLHVGCTWLVFLILLQLEFSKVSAFLVSLLWALHPLQVESVAWISERKNVLSAFFFLLAFLWYVRHQERWRPWSYGILLIVFLAALLSKMVTVVLPAVCLAYLVCFRRRPRRNDWIAMLPLFALGAAVVAVNLWASPSHGEWRYHGGSAVVTWLSMTVVVVRYLANVVLPVDLRPWYDVELQASPFDPAVAGSILCLLAIGVLTVFLVRRRHRGAFWILWFFLTLSPMLNLVPFRSMMQDRYLYLPLLGPLALVATVLLAARPRGVRWATVAVALLIAVWWGTLSFRQVEVWSDPVAHWVQGARNTFPTVDPLPDPDRSQKRARLEALRADTPDPAALNNALGAVEFRAGNFPDALAYFEEAQRLRPDDANILMNLGRAHARLRNLEEARGALERSVTLRPHNLLAQLHLARLQLQMGDGAAARSSYDAVERIWPGSLAHPAFRSEMQALETLEGSPPGG